MVDIVEVGEAIINTVRQLGRNRHASRPDADNHDRRRRVPTLPEFWMIWIYSTNPIVWWGFAVVLSPRARACWATSRCTHLSSS